MRTLTLLSVMVTLLVACKPDEEIITGDIVGTVKLFDQYYAPVEAMPGIPVSLTGKDGLCAVVQTDESGQFVFEDIPYGKYTITSSKEGYHLLPVEQTDHLGGYSPTLTQVYLYEIPTFQLELDSIAYGGDYMLMLFLKLNGDTLLPPSGVGLYTIVFASNSPDISKDQFKSWNMGFLLDRWQAGYSQPIRLYARILGYDFHPSISELISAGPIFIRLHPVAWGGFGGASYQFDPLALGKPSDTLSFNWDDVVGE